MINSVCFTFGLWKFFVNYKTESQKRTEVQMLCRWMGKKEGIMPQEANFGFRAGPSEGTRWQKDYQFSVYTYWALLQAGYSAREEIQQTRASSIDWLGEGGAIRKMSRFGKKVPDLCLPDLGSPGGIQVGASARAG